MTAAEHRAEAERLLGLAQERLFRRTLRPGSALRAVSTLLLAAQVHATLALAPGEEGS